MNDIVIFAVGFVVSLVYGSLLIALLWASTHGEKR
jgi:hypothetical protein